MIASIRNMKPETWKKLKTLATLHGITIAEMVEKMVNEVFKKYIKKEPK